MEALPIETRFAATDLVTGYFTLVDHGRAGEVADLFTPDGTLTFGPGSPAPGTIAGDDIRKALTARQAQVHVTTRHVLTNISVVAGDDGSILVESILTLYRSDDETRPSTVASVADITDRLVQFDGRLRIASRLIRPIFNRA